MSASYRIKLSSRLRPFVGRVSRSGWVQKAFAEQIGRPTGACVRAGVHRGMSVTEIRHVASVCAKQLTGTKLYRGDTGYYREIKRTGGAF